MRITFNDTGRPKAAAKLIVRSVSGIRLNEAQDAIAKATGHRDWHDLAAATPEASGPVDDETAIACVIAVSDALGIGTGAVQYALAKSRVLTGMTLERSLSIQARAWRERLFGAGGRGRPGTVVRVRSPGENQPGYLLRQGRPTYVMLDGGVGMRADFEVKTPRRALPDFVPSRLWLPYGFWTLADGAIVTFSRDYMPMWRSENDGTERMDPWLHIEGIRSETHFSTQAGTVDWAGGRAREMALAHLDERRITCLPRLVDVMGEMLDPSVETVGDAVARLRGATAEAA